MSPGGPEHDPRTLESILQTATESVRALWLQDGVETLHDLENLYADEKTARHELRVGGLLEDDIQIAIRAWEQASGASLKSSAGNAPLHTPPSAADVTTV